MKSLRILVFSMGFVLMGGMILLVTLIYQRTQADIKRFESNNVCPELESNITPKGKVESASLSGGDMLTVLVNTPAGQQIELYDMCTGELRHSVKVN